MNGVRHLGRGFIVFFVVASSKVWAQDPTVIEHGGEIICHVFGADTEGFLHSTHGEKRRNALRRAIQMWEEVLSLSRPIHINVRFENTPGANAVGRASAMHYIEEATHFWMLYPSPLATQMSAPEENRTPYYPPGSELEILSGVHGAIEFNLEYAKRDLKGNPYFFYEEDVTLLPSMGLIDFQTTATHEMGHVLGISSGLRKDGSYDFWMLSAYDYNLFYPWGTPDAFENLAPWLDGVRSAAVQSVDQLFWAGQHGNFLARNVWSSTGCLGWLFDNLMIQADGSASHINLAPRLLMSPYSQFGIHRRNLDVTPGMLADMGYSTLLQPIFRVVPPSNLPPATKFLKELYDTQIIIKAQNRGPLELDLEVSLLNPGSGNVFELTSDPVASVRPWEEENILIGFIEPPGTQKIYIGQLDIHSNDPERVDMLVSFASYKEMSDSDGDGLADDAETFDFDEGGGFYNPFDPEDSDSTGDDGATTSDGILDGFNDFDDDGVSNMAEFDLGYDPLGPGDYPTIDDTDGDGLSDYDELRDLDFSTEGIQNPLDPWRSDGDEDGILDGEEDYDGDGLPNAVELTHPTIFDVLQEDVTGDDGAFGPDTILDGQNDFDNDGISNEEEVRYGLDIVVYTTIGDIEWQLCVDEF